MKADEFFYKHSQSVQALFVLMNTIINIKRKGGTIMSLRRLKRRLKKLEKKVTRSSFKAVNVTAPIPVPVANTFVKVFFPNELFDVRNEYDQTTSTFIAQRSGIYYFTAAVIFSPTNTNVDYEVTLQFRKNGAGEDVESDYIGFNAAFAGVIEVNDVIQLNAGDQVDVLVLSTTPGVVIADSRVRFAAARFPSPI